MAKRSGYFLVYRDIWRNPVFKNLLQASCWIYFISSASHQDKTIRFLENDIFIRRGEAVMPMRVTAKRFGMTYTEMRNFIQRLVRRKMITTRLNQLQPSSNHPNRKVTIISLVNYDKYQFVDDSKSALHHLPQQVLIHNTNTQVLNIRSSKDDNVNNGYKKIGEEGHYLILLKDSKKYLKHKWKDEPIKDY